MKRPLMIISVIALMLATTGWNPFSPYRETQGVLAKDFTELETGVQRQANGIYVVKALTRMPKVKSHMVKWWFADYMQTTEHYKKWHPTAHVWMDWENKIPGEIIGASHLVHEYIGKEFHKLRIQFVHPSEFLDQYQEQDEQFVVCARTGLLEEPLYMGSFCHVVRDTAWGAEMRSIFWLGQIHKREGNEQVASIEGLIGNTTLARYLLGNGEMPTDLMVHAIEEMGYLSDFLPGLYLKENTSSIAQITAEK
jgi:DAPG hydrolase PhiG domain